VETIQEERGNGTVTQEGTRKCKTEGKGESGENLPAGRQGGRKSKELFPLSFFPFFPSGNSGQALCYTSYYI
jgi:hypothetical protein